MTFLMHFLFRKTCTLGEHKRLVLKTRKKMTPNFSMICSLKKRK